MPGRSFVGIKSIKMGTCGTNGTMGTTLAALGLIVPDSVVFSIPSLEKTDINVEDMSTAYKTVTDGQITPTFEFEIRDCSPATIAKFYGGTLAAEKFTPNVVQSVIEQSVEVQTNSSGGYYYKFCYPRCVVTAELVGKIVKKDTGTLKVKMTAISPLDGGGNPLAPYTYERVVG